MSSVEEHVFGKRKKKRKVISVADSIWGIKEKESKPTKRPDYGIRKEIEAEGHLKRRFRVVSAGRKLIRSPASHGPGQSVFWRRPMCNWAHCSSTQESCKRHFGTHKKGLENSVQMDS